MQLYETVIGLEVHVELATKSKIFCGCSAEFGKEPNTRCCPVCLGMPGTLPVLNKKVVDYAIMTGLALHAEIASTCKFDRKNYFYPDLPKAYQISQLYLPICRNGWLEVKDKDQEKRFRIHELHMEEDAGKLVHKEENNVSLIDYNRCGIPLIEIVSEPDMRSAEDAVAYLEKLKEILHDLSVSDCKMQEGSLRVDVNLSVRKAGEKELGTRTEMKNLNSFRAVAKAIESEQNRQIKELIEGRTVRKETRRWEDGTGTSIAMRVKEEAAEYRYFPEPEIPPITISEEWKKEMKDRLPELRDARIARYETVYGISHYDAVQITVSKKLADLFEETQKLCGNAKEIVNWLMVEGMRFLRAQGKTAEEIQVSAKSLADMIGFIETGKINRTAAKEVFEQICLQDMDVEDYIYKHNLILNQDEDALRSLIQEIMNQHRKSVSDYRNGKKQAAGFLIGQTMKAAKGKADPTLVNQIIYEELENGIKR